MCLVFVCDFFLFIYVLGGGVLFVWHVCVCFLCVGVVGLLLSCVCSTACVVLCLFFCLATCC